MSRRSQGPSPRCGGSGIACTRRSSSATGAGLSIVCPVGTGDPCDIALRQRNSTGSRPAAAAQRSICDSQANAVCTAPKPLVGVQPLGGDEQVGAALAVGDGEGGFGAEERLVL